MRSTLLTPTAAALSLVLLARPGPGVAAEGGAAGGDSRSAAGAPLDAPASGVPTVREHLTLDLPFHAALTGGLLLASGLIQLEVNRLAAPSCRWCEPNPLDRWARRQLSWKDVKAAGTLSDVLMAGVAVGAAATLGLTARADGAGTRELVEDLVVVAEAVSVATLLTQAAKLGTGRLRPDAWASGGSTTADSKMSFWGGHSMLAFAVAGAATRVARLRGRPGWKWLAVATFAGAAGAGWMRIAADRHWLSDVVVGAGVGTLAGLGVPLLVLRPAGDRATPVTLAAAPGGMALRF
jgi:hypothetical protein